MSRDPTRKAIGRALFAAAVGALMAGGVAVALGFGAVPPGLAARAFAFAGLAVAAIALWVLHDMLSGHFRALARIEALAVALRNGRVEARIPGGADEDEAAGRLRDGLLALAAERHRLETLPDDRLTAVLANVGEALVVVTRQGQVSLVNGPAKALLGDARLTVGTSVFAAFDRALLVEAMHHAASSAHSVPARLVTVDGMLLDATIVDLREHHGALICIPAPTSASRHVEHDLSLHDAPPAAPPPDASTPLSRLPALVLDTETTGLDAANARIVALGAVRMFGPRIYRGVTVDCLVNPGVAIPPASTAVHGIDDGMVASIPGFADQARQLLGHLGSAAVVGHNIGFDIAVLKAEAARVGLAWPETATLCTAQLAAALDPDETVLDLDAVAARHGVAVEGRHTALGDSLVTAELFARMIARLADRGIDTFGAAQDFAATARSVVARQRAAGW